MSEDEWVEAATAGWLIGVPPEQMARWIDEGVLPAQWIGGMFRIRRSDIDRVIASRMHRFLPRAKTDAASRRGAAGMGYDATSAEQWTLLDRFVRAFQVNEPGPCPVCGDELPPHEWADHIRLHR